MFWDSLYKDIIGIKCLLFNCFHIPLFKAPCTSLIIWQLYAWVGEICHEDAEERAIMIGVAQTLGQAFIAWVPGDFSFP